MKQECKYKKLLSSFLDEELSHSEADKVRLHIKTCRDCRKEVESLRFTDGFITGLPETELAVGFDKSFWEKIAHIEEKKRRWSLPDIFSFRWQHYFTGAIMAVLIAAFIFFNNRTSVPGNEDEIIAEHLELLRDYELIDHLDLLENWDIIITLKEKS